MSVPPSTAFVAALVVLFFSVEKSGFVGVEAPAVISENVAILTGTTDEAGAACSCQCSCPSPVPCDFGRLVSSGPELLVLVAVAIGISVCSWAVGYCCRAGGAVREGDAGRCPDGGQLALVGADGALAARGLQVYRRNV